LGENCELLAKTHPEIESDEFFFDASKDNKVVLPAPEGPMMASIYPGLQ
jgi:hypothetical protein